MSRKINRRVFLQTAALGSFVFHPRMLTKLTALQKSKQNLSLENIAQDEDYWFQIRHAYSIDRNQINLNSGSVSPAPKVVQKAMNDYLTIRNMSPSLYIDEIIYPHKENVRRRLAQMFGCNVEELAIVRNTNEGMQTVQLGLDLKKGDEVLTTTQDYPNMLNAWDQRIRRDGIRLKKVPYKTPPNDMNELVKLFKNNISSRTKVIMFCHITYTTGQIFPVKEICDFARKKGITTIVDGAHAFAHFPFTVEDLGCDFYATSLHKWLNAPIGSGFLYARKDRIKDVWSLMASTEAQKDNIRKFEVIGTAPIANIAAITEAVAFNKGIGIDRKAARLRYLKNTWMNNVKTLDRVKLYTSLDAEQSCGIGAMEIDGIGAMDLTNILKDKYKIHIRPRFVPDEFECIRVTPNLFTTMDDIHYFSDVIQKIIANS